MLRLEREKALIAEVEKCQIFMLHISDDCFHQGLCQVAFFHNMPAEDTQYDVDKVVVEGKVVRIDGGMDEAMKDAEGNAENVTTSHNEPESSFEELFDLLLMKIYWLMKISWTRYVGVKQYLLVISYLFCITTSYIFECISAY